MPRTTSRQIEAHVCPRCHQWRTAAEFSAPHAITSCSTCEWTLRHSDRECRRCHRVLHGSRFTVGGTGSVCRECARTNRSTRRATARTERAQVADAPSWLDRAFGVEFEFNGSASAVLREMRAQGLGCELESYNHQTRTWWKIVPDATVPRGAELVSPVLRGADGLEQLRKASAALKAAGAKVGRNTGTHVHFDARGETLDSIRSYVLAYHERADLIDPLVAPSRRMGRNGMCRRFDTYSLQRLAATQTLSQLGRIDRYQTINVQAYGRHGTVENRQHQGTIESDKVAAWVELNLRLWAAAREARTVSTTNTWEMLRDLGMDDEQVAWWQNRARVLSRHETTDRYATYTTTRG